MRIKLLDEIQKAEGYRRDPYKDPEGFITGGFGHFLTPEDLDDFNPDWTNDQKDTYWALRFAEDIYTAVVDVSILSKNFIFKPTRECEEVLIEMMFNIGLTKLCKFTGMFDAISKGDYEAAANEMIDSKWHRDFVRWNGGKDTPNIRSRRLERKMRGS